MFKKHLTDQDYEMAMLRIDAVTKYCAIVTIKSNRERVGSGFFVECMNKIGQPPKVVYTDGETGIRNTGLFQKYFNENHITYVAIKSHPIVAERMIFTFKEMRDKRIKPNVQCADLIYPILLTYNKKRVHSATGLTPKEARALPNELEAYVNMKLKATPTEDTLREKLATKFIYT